MNIRNSVSNLSENAFGHVFIQKWSIDAVSELYGSTVWWRKLCQFLAQTKFHHKIDGVLGIDDFKQAHDIRMVHAREDIDLTMNGHQLRLLRQLFLFISFESNLVTSHSVSAFLDDSILTWSNLHVDCKVLFQVENRIFALWFELVNGC